MGKEKDGKLAFLDVLIKLNRKIDVSVYNVRNGWNRYITNDMQITIGETVEKAKKICFVLI